jgi:hypothetical protein
VANPDRAYGKLERGKEQCDSKVPIGPDDDDVLKKKSEMCQQTHSEWTNPYPGSSGKLKVFIQPAIKNKTFLRIARIEDLDGVTKTIEVILVESSFIQIRPKPKARSNGRPAQSCLDLFLDWDEFQFDSGNRQAQVTGGRVSCACGESVRRTLGSAKPGDAENLFSASFESQVLKLVPDALAQAGSGEENAPQAAEEVFA